MNKLPNLFIVGAEKAATTFLAQNLARHPDIFSPPIKEPQFFSTDKMPKTKHEKRLWNLPKNRWHIYSHNAFIRDENLYLALFSEQEPRHRYLLDASTSYLYSHNAAQRIHRFNPSSKIIISLRNPITRAFSAYKMDLTIGGMRMEFSDAIRVKRTYLERSLYYRQVKRYFDTFDKSDILILFFEDIKSDPAEAFRKIFDFLSLPQIEFKEYEKVNEGTSPRFALLNQLLYSSGIKTMIVELLPPSIKNLFKRFYYAKDIAPAIDEDTYRYLLEYFYQDVTNLSTLLGRDLVSYWLENKKER